MSHVAAIVLGAGSGARVGSAVAKTYIPVGRDPIVVHAARALGEHPDVDELYVVASAGAVGLCDDTLREGGVRAHGVLPGGATRHASEHAALEAIAPRIEAGEISIVVIHDGARPLVDAATVRRTIAAAREHGAAIAALPVRRPLAEVADGVLARRQMAGDLWRAQTPQAFAARPLLDAFRRAAQDGFEGSDTALSVERLGIPVVVVEGDERNIKVTYPIDLLRAERLLAAAES
jgi:2-C-methyl-D-erythritol 4-phosphate cytidylyltransferase